MTLTAETTHQTAETRLVEAAGVELAYRRFGHATGIPLVLLQHFRGNLDNWDPAHTKTSQAKGMEFLGRFTQRQEDRDAPTSNAARDAQYDAIVEWGIPDHAALQRLTGIESPTLIIQGDDDLMIPTKLSHLMAGLIPDARIRIYPDAAHGFLFQYPDEVAAEVNAFLSREGRAAS
jgi:pimeloyl-ACP methyl ester carboxylesterase